MGTNYLDLLIKTIIAFPFGIGFVYLLSLSIKRFEHFDFMNYQRQSFQRFKDTLFATLYTFGAIVCLSAIYLSFQDIKLLFILPLILCAFIPAIPICILGVYWQSYQTKKLFGGLLPIVSTKYDYPQSQPVTQRKVDLAKVKLPRRIIIPAVLIAIIAVITTYFGVNSFEWNINAIAALLIKLGMSGFMGFGIFMTIVTLAVSRRFQKLRNNNLSDSDDDI
jgi:hypothetical protein